MCNTLANLEDVLLSRVCQAQKVNTARVHGEHNGSCHGIGVGLEDRVMKDGGRGYWSR